MYENLWPSTQLQSFQKIGNTHEKIKFVTITATTDHWSEGKGQRPLVGGERANDRWSLGKDRAARSVLAARGYRAGHGVEGKTGLAGRFSGVPGSRRGGACGYRGSGWADSGYRGSHSSINEGQGYSSSQGSIRGFRGGGHLMRGNGSRPGVSGDSLPPKFPHFSSTTYSPCTLSSTNLKCKFT